MKAKTIKTTQIKKGFKIAIVNQMLVVEKVEFVNNICIVTGSNGEIVKTPISQTIYKILE